jgi:uncharacterized protein YndB with AHSA1/START domain
MSGNATTILPVDKPMIITTRVLNAPRELVWKVLSSPDHLKHFWGPDGFTNTYKTFDFSENGESRFIMHGPDGKDWPNRMIYRKLDAPRFIRWEHDNGGEGDWDHKFVGEIELFEEGNKTRIELRVIEPSMESRDNIAQYAVEGGKQNLDRMAAYLAPLANDKNLFTIERVFAVSQERLFEACSDLEQKKKWFAPKGMSVIAAKQDFKPGGTYHYGLATGQGQDMWGLARFKEIKPHSRIVYSQHFSDKDGGVTRHPMAPTWPLEMIATFDFTPEDDNQTRLKISWVYAGVDDAEAATFHASHDGMCGGWTATLDALQTYLDHIPTGRYST